VKRDLFGQYPKATAIYQHFVRAHLKRLVGTNSESARQTG